MTADTNPAPMATPFEDIRRAEIAAINQRRKMLGREELSLALDGDTRRVIDAVGLALSGGGLRSAAFSLGVLQALNHHDALRNVDYISTVSGGGYVGSSLTATMTQSQGRFVFGNAPTNDAGQAASEISDTAAVGHLRNYSNYLVPAGGRDLLTGAAIIFRGLIANFALVLPVLLLFAAATILTNPHRTLLGCPDLLGYPLCGQYFSVENFGLTLLLTLLGVAIFFLWALYRSSLGQERLSEFRTMLPFLASAYLVLVAATFFLELQSFFIKGMFDIADAVKASNGSSELLTGTLKTLAAIAAPVAALVTFFRQQLGDIFKATSAGARRSTKVIAALGKIALWVAGAALPLVVWVVYLYLSYWGIINDTAPIPETYTPAAVAEAAPVETRAEDLFSKSDPGYCTKWAPTEETFDHPWGAHTPRWMIRFATWHTFSVFCPVFKSASSVWWVTEWLFDRILARPMVLFYCVVGLALLILSWFLRPNANSLHRLYRDRLSKAFLFDPRDRNEPRPAVKRNEPSLDQGRDFPQLDHLLISELSSPYAPYHLINAALNIQGSDYANRRGRDADFFLFSPCYVGSEATGYAPTTTFERVVKDLDLATAMAISGAAASSNMGGRSIRPLRPTLALLNIRLGYWVKNPRYVASNGACRRAKTWRRHRRTLYLWSEIAGRLYENSDDIYLTDGGHIENLGVYELLKRRCKLIVVVDAEADFAMHFPSFITLQHYARIDFGCRIDMPWSTIQKTTCSWMGHHSDRGQTPLSAASQGPHAAIGYIDYGGGEHGFLLYVKSSLTGDENDYIRDYARRYARFPHESTGDQFFSEEQFEVYRALGFHTTHGLLCGRDGLEVIGAGRQLTLKDTENEAVKAVRTALISAPRCG
jgi:hypothetical protein